MRRNSVVLVRDVPELLEGEDPSDFEGAPPADRSREARAHRRAWAAWVEAQCVAWRDGFHSKPSPGGDDTLRRIRGGERQEWGELMATAHLNLVQTWRAMEAKGKGVLAQDENGELVWMPAGVGWLVPAGRRACTVLAPGGPEAGVCAGAVGEWRLAGHAAELGGVGAGRARAAGGGGPLGL